MAYRGQAPHRGPNRKLWICQQLGIPYPPDPNRVYAFIQGVKHDAERALQANRFQDAENLYTMCLMAVQVFPDVQYVAEEHHKLLANRSLVYLQMRHYKGAEEDAKSAIALCPTFLKGYWRVCQAVKGGFNGCERAMPYLVEGLRLAQHGHGNQHDVITFLAEICSLAPKATNTDKMVRILAKLELPDERKKDTDVIWARVIQKLSTQSHWESIAFILNSHNGPENMLDDVDINWDTKAVSVDKMLSEMSHLSVKNWGEELAVTLLDFGSSVHDIGHKQGLPTLHFVVKISIKIESTQLLLKVLEMYEEEACDKQNQQTGDGNTALHILVQICRGNSAIGETILRILLDHNCDVNIVNEENKKPIDYVKRTDTAYKLLQNSSKSVGELRQELDILKAQGNTALRERRYEHALTQYDLALKIAGKCKRLYKEAAIVYSNKANVFFTLKRYEDALTNSIAAVSCDISYHKGHWWKAKTLLTMGSTHEAYSAYLEGCINSETNDENRLNFLMEAVLLLKCLPENELVSCYGRLRFLNKAVWIQVLDKMSRLSEWKCIALLILGPDLDKSRFGKKVKEDNIHLVCTGVAGGGMCLGVLQMNTVFQYLQQCRDVKEIAPWLDAALFAVYVYGDVQSLKNLAVNHLDCPLHGAVRLALKTGRTSLLEEFPVQDPTDEQNGENYDGDSVFHAITKMRPLPEPSIVKKVTHIMLQKGLSAMTRDNAGKLPVEYLDNQFPGYVFDIFFKASNNTSIEDIKFLKEDGNVEFKRGNTQAAVDLYTKALNVFKVVGIARSKLSHREIAVLYGNRAEGYLKLKLYQFALNDAKESVSFDGHWYKGHMRVGRALHGLDKMENAMKAFINAYRDVDRDVKDKVKVEILTELATVCSHIPRSVLDVTKRIDQLPGDEGHIWAQTCYELVCKHDWGSAGVAYCQFSVGNPKRPHFTFDMKPLCNIGLLKRYPWGVDLIFYLVECGSNRKTISLDKGDTYLHAVVKITLLAARSMHLLQYLLRQYCRAKRDTDQLCLDSRGNTVLHTATLEKEVDKKRRHDVLIYLLKSEVDPNVRNNSGKLAIDYLPQSTEQQSIENLRMAMYNKENISKLQVQGPTVSKSGIRKEPLSEVIQPKKLRPDPGNVCDLCDDLYSQGTIKLAEDNLSEGYGKLAECITQKHKGSRHNAVVKRCVSGIIQKLSETHNPEIPRCLTNMGRDMYMMVMDGLTNSRKWRQLDTVVRKYRSAHGKDQFKGFAKGLTVVPVIMEPSLKGAEHLKIQIMVNFHTSGATMGTDNGQTAIRRAIEQDHYRVVGELVRLGADTTSMSMYTGDTPVHAVLTIVLEKDKSVSLLEHILDEFKKKPDVCPHMDPEQLDCNGDCLFHLVAKAKYNSHILKVTELLCGRVLSANYYNKAGKLPQDYITKKNDRRLQFLRLARSVKPARDQSFGPDWKKSENSSTQEDLHLGERRADSGINKECVVEVESIVSMRDKRKRKINELIGLLPDSKHSVFSVDSAENPTSKKTCTVDYGFGDVGKLDREPMTDITTNESNNSHRTTEMIEVNAEGMFETVVPVCVHAVDNQNNNADDSVDDISTENNESFVTAEEELDESEADEQGRSNNKEKSLERMTDENNPGIQQNSGILGEGIQPNDGMHGEGIQPNDGMLAEGIQPNDGTLGERIQPNDGMLGEVIQPNDGILGEAIQPNDGMLVEGIQQNDGRLGEAIQPNDGILVEPIQPNDEMLGEAIQPNDGILVEPIQPNDEMLGEAIQQNDEQEVNDSDDEEDLDEEDHEIDAQVFDNLEWEVECTVEVWKTLRDKHISPALKHRIVHKIQLLATGDWQPHLCKKLKNVPCSLNLFEAKFSKGSRILWELAVAFSPRLSETADRRLQGESDNIAQPVIGGRIYSEIIRVWEIVLDHDKIHRCVQHIKKSHQRGETCIVQKKLRGMKCEHPPVPLGAGKRYPVLYAEDEVSNTELEKQHQVLQSFFPPASSKETEYHILKFYSFSSTLVSHVLHNIEMKVDFPFRVTDLEHAIINLRSKAPILLLGRSGTGKTTCCMYRLWSQFVSYWTKAKEAGAPLLPRCVEFVHQETDITSDEEDEVDIEESDDERTESPCTVMEAECFTQVTEDGAEDNSGYQYDHIHQVFITKNAVLCSEVQKNFRELSHADDLMAEHAQHEDDVLPFCLQEVQDHSFPLFVTSRQLLLMLDASLPPPCFFDRKEDGSLKVEIAGWGDVDGPLSVLPLLDGDSDDDEEEQYIEDETLDDNRQPALAEKRKVDPRKEITYTVFVEEIWRHMKKKEHSSYHPSLVWMEIMSFIKGSYEALSKPLGYLLKEEYIKLGRKRAPNFSGERAVIYDLFKKYEHFKKQHLMFDETDLVHDVFVRLRHLPSRDWVLHQIYVDETQDFTQGELCLLLRLCQNPNDMFLTGDTAQSIMRGISFRFSDLKSLFYHARHSMQAMGKTSSIEVPKQVYQLTHNYRSHAGILSLATSVLELMVEFFPESFDRLQPDQGLFEGPKPILLESCSFRDLAVLLRGNRRKTSHIEFGAHQAILVVSDAARDNIPEELRLGLVLTIYESKGLEFDDVLLYNFFKDSQAGKEWRVVTAFLEKLAANCTDATSSSHDHSLVTINQDVLEESNRPRPLNFDPNLHKVLNSELKQLYTALTRARVNVWVFDEDLDKRAPMFEYFKARKLVKNLQVEEINETSLAETVFAEKSSASDWIRRGEDFMRHSLYDVAAKCFGMGGDRERENIAQAHGQALQASRLKDHPRQMRDEFLHAAELYLQCNRPTKAAICLQNAKERELAAELFEKLGQYERAGEIYRRMKRPLASSRCYEQQGNFNKAIEVLFESENYDMAIDTLRRYSMLIKEFVEKGSPIPQQLLDNKPDTFYTEEKLSHRAADYFYRYKNEERMLEAIDKFSNITDRVEFLKKKNYINYAARILEDNGDSEGAANLLLIYGKLDEANMLARKTLNESIIAKCLLVTCRTLMSRKIKVESPDQSLLDCLKEAILMFQACDDNDNFGAVKLLQAELSKDKTDMRNAWKAFKSSKPFENEAGLVECTDWMVRSLKLQEMDVLRTVVRGLGHLFNVCQALIEPNTPYNSERVFKYDKFYGLNPYSKDNMAVHPKENPLCLAMLPNIFQSKGTRKRKLVEVPKTEVREDIALYLLNRSKSWLEPVYTELQSQRERYVVCEYFILGMECPNIGNVDGACRMLHQSQKIEHFKSMIEIDILMIEYESNIQNGTDRLNKTCPDSVKQVLDDFRSEWERDFTLKYQACFSLWNDLMPAQGHSMMIGADSLFLVQHITRNDTVCSHLRQFLINMWRKATCENDKKLKCQAVKQTEVFLKFEFGYHLFHLDSGKFKLGRSPATEMTNLERQLDREIIDKKEGKQFKSKIRYYTLMMAPDSHTMNVQCVARRFTDAYNLLSVSYDPYEAVMKFTKFVKLLDDRSDITFFPDIKHYIMWLEFFTTVALLVIAKLKTRTFPNFLFVVPSHYLNLVKFVEATFHNRCSVTDIVDKWTPYRQPIERLQERLTNMTFAVSGYMQRVRIMESVVERCKGDPTLYVLVERLLILAMTLVCNVGKSVSLEAELRLMEMATNTDIPTEAPNRVRHAFSLINEAKGIQDVVSVLGHLLQERTRDEELMVCFWRQHNKKDKIEAILLEAERKELFSPAFLHYSTLSSMHTAGYQHVSAIETGRQPVEEEQTEEEIRRSREEKAAQKREERRHQAATVIARWYRNILSNRTQLHQTIQKSEIDNMFAAVKVDHSMCGICGVSFSEKLQELLKYESSTIIGAQSVLNDEGKTTAWTSLPSQFSEDNRPLDGAWGKRQDLQQGKQEHGNVKMDKIRSAHRQSEDHKQKQMTFNAFRLTYKNTIEPNLKKVKDFISSSGLDIDDQSDHSIRYSRHQIEIDRMLRQCQGLEQEVELLIRSKNWSHNQKLKQMMMEMLADFDIVKPFVSDVLKQLEDERQKQLLSSTSGTQYGTGENWEDDVDDIEQVVEEPSTARNKKRHYRGTRHR